MLFAVLRFVVINNLIASIGEVKTVEDDQNRVLKTKAGLPAIVSGSRLPAKLFLKATQLRRCT